MDKPRLSSIWAERGATKTAPTEKARFRRFCRAKGISGRQKKKFRQFLNARSGSASDALEGSNG